MTAPEAEKLTSTEYSKDFEAALDSFLETRGGSQWRVLHGNGAGSRMARFEQSTLQEFEDHSGCLSGKRVLDFGCGSGTITPSLALRADEVVAFDINTEAVEITRRRLVEHDLEHVSVYCSDSYADIAEELGSFDVVIMHAVFEHVPLSIKGLRGEVIRQAYDAVAPGGYLLISESPNRLYPRDIYCTGLWLLPWTKGGSKVSYMRAIRAGRHTDPDGRGPVSLEERGAWGFTYFALRRYLRMRSFAVVNGEPGHNRWVRYHRQLSAKRRLFESTVYHTVTRWTGVPIAAFTPMLSPLVLRRNDAPTSDI